MVQRSTEAQKAISQKNRANILRFIRDHKDTTRHDIAAHLQLSHTTVKAYVEELCAEGLIEEAGMAASMGGRKPVIVRLVPNARFSLGVNVAPGHIELLLLNLLREEVDRRQLLFDTTRDFSDVLDELAQTIHDLLAECQVNRDKLLGIGMTFPGLVDDSQDMLIFLANLGGQNFSLKPFEKQIGLQVFAENEAQAVANAERILGGARDRSNLVYISIAEGIGAGIMINNAIYRSNGKNAGEFGHVHISDEPVSCNCGRTGCWERFASRDALLSGFLGYENTRIRASALHGDAALVGAALLPFEQDLFIGEADAATT